jgi:alpha-tubulin suppressor-like RCC1 family protein
MTRPLVLRTIPAVAVLIAATAGAGPARGEGTPATLALGHSHTCAARAGAVWCWGANDAGQLGDGTNTDRALPVPVTTLGNAVAEVAAGDLFSCARKSNGSVWCWGSNVAGQLGNGGGADSATPVAVTGLSYGVAQISAGDLFVCALKTDGTLWCWGGGGIFADGAATATPVAVTALADGVAEISAGDGAACARKTDGTLWCWGSNTFGILGDGTDQDRPSPVPVTALGAQVAGVSLGDLFGCALKVDGTVWCWGTNDSGELGDGTNADHFSPAQVVGLGAGIREVSANGRHACARDAQGALRCWGANAQGELGDGTTADAPSPVAVVPPGDRAVEVATGINHTTCARLREGGVACWGGNSAGQLGDGTTVDRAAPTPVALPPSASQVPAGRPVTSLALALALLAAGAALLSPSRNRRKTVASEGAR